MYTLKELRERKSVRGYTDESLSESIRNTLNAEATFINSHEAGLNFQVRYDDADPFRGLTRSYGMFRGVRNYLAVVIDPTFEFALERAGYFAEGYVMKAVSLGLGTCFVGGTFSRSSTDVRMEVYEKLPFLVAFGHAAAGAPLIARIGAAVAHRKNMDESRFFGGSVREYAEALRKYPWLQKGIRAVACAPSALNARPVRICVESDDDGLHVMARVDDYEKNAVDLGIAKFNFAAAVGGEWEWGNGGKFLPW